MDITNQALEQLVIARVAVRLIEILKQWNKLPWVNEKSDAINKAISWFIAIATSAGIRVASSGSVDDGWVIQITVPSMQVLVQFAVGAVYQQMMQEAWYRGIKKRAKVASLGAADDGTSGELEQQQ